ncbi:MAG: hypothetical protein A3D31_17860 [Candidatus Fluviicola riflensis]|nr:MAG: hypothetical protein CHH17_02800 [Candidatus Fluviicola riflensis]OGS76850.1 MAG: hypothetical protein A3D31_17860 [Candidatus Fluviicola riflensis]OGS81780.1 MAG: hypothetical protein A2724_15260 [Fluviicola sp. RIFCSPHIGHO2_01_FULL_43_53]OGS88579.1 MAG: hypothetical protein A3E30_07370 [Fluviicola sp. RIFCSPHIGHO2_12_FULL_43_24]
MKIVLILLFFTSAFFGFSQTGKLTLSISDYNNFDDRDYDDTTYYTLHVFNEATSLNKTVMVEWQSGETSIDSLLPGDYQLQWSNTEPDSTLVYQCRFTIQKDQATVLSIDLYADGKYCDIDPETNDLIVTERMENQFELGYFNNQWTENNPAVTSSVSIASSFSYWYSFSKHVGVIVGAGVGITHSSFAKDTAFFDAPQFDKRYEYYNYLYLSPEAKIRFTLKNQQQDHFPVKGLMIDLGARYNFPFAFKHVGRFAGNTKIVDSGLHQFTDFRTFVSIGRTPVLVFAEYRLLDFILGNYPELPKYMVGIKIALDYRI